MWTSRFFRFKEIALAALFLQLTTHASAAEPSAGNPPLIRVKKIAPKIVVDMRYATDDNFAHQRFYPAAECLLCEAVAKRLARVQKNLEKQGLGLKVWDCYRPLSVQKKLWELVPNPDYVADPKTGSRHNRGASVDLTLVDKSGSELPMPTPFDEFTERAHRNYSNLSPEVIKNRETLQKAMEAEGFVGLPTEWWHFDDPEWATYALRDEPLDSKSLAKDKPAMPIPASANQLIVVTSPDWRALIGRLQRFERAGGKWKKVGASWQVSLGLRGMSWGRGLHPGKMSPPKAESDKTATAGVYRVGHAYGYANEPPAETSWPYQPVDENWRCVDDPASRLYNQVVKVDSDSTKDWNSAEMMKRSDHLYKWVINIDQNFPEVKTGCGSCIFLHVWRRDGAPTEGCTAMAEENIVTLLKWLKPESQPVIVQLPAPAYRKLKKSWGLP